jgi:alkylation response protein AidB-like acyl-CoA dehydrogenase
VDFDLSEEQQELRQLAARIFADLAGHDQQRRLEAAAAEALSDVGECRPADEAGSGPRVEARFDRRLWSALAEVGLLGLVVPEEHGGAGLGFLEACVVIEEAGKAAAPVPLAAATVGGALPLARFAGPQVKKTWLARIASGEALVSACLGGAVGDPLRPPATAAPATVAGVQRGGWRLQGVLDHVAAGMVADAVVVAARAELAPGPGAGIGLFLLDPTAPGVTRRRQEATDGRVEARLELDGVEIGGPEVLVEPGPAGEEAHRWCCERALAASCVEIAGACRAALDLTARYTAERVQFGKPIATFQAVGQRAADAYIDTEAVRLTAWQAVWRLDRELPASAEVAVAKFWADDGAQRVVHAAQHLHGGVGVDRDYPLHRYYLLVKHLAPAMGGATPSLLRLGDLLAQGAE